jgi:type I restriction enzyme R subunit
MEAAIKKELLPRLFKLLGLEKAKQVIERIVQITRMRLSRESGRHG